MGLNVLGIRSPSTLSCIYLLLLQANRGTYHDASRWGIHFRTEKSIHLGQATVDAGQSGSFTAVVSHYDGNDFFDPIHERTIDVGSGVNEINLDMALEPGEYLLTRDGSFPLRGGKWNCWENQTRNGIELLDGAKPGDFDTNRYWYYFFDVTVTELRLRDPYHD